MARQIAEYVSTDGAKPIFRYGSPLLLLTTQGRRTGIWRRTCLIYGPLGTSYVIVASLGGSSRHPHWYVNLSANPRVWLQVGADTFWAAARDATAEERPALWEKMVALYPDYANYQRRTKRVIPLVVLEPL